MQYKKNGHKTMKEKMIHVIDILIEEIEEIHGAKIKTPEEREILPKLVNSIVQITEYAAFEEKEDEIT